MLIKVDDTFRDGEVIGSRDFVKEVEDKFQNLEKISRGQKSRRARLGVVNTNLVTEPALLDNSHADIQNVFQQFLASSGFAIQLLLIVTGPDNSLPKDIQALRLNCNTNHLAVTLLPVTVLE